MQRKYSKKFISLFLILTLSALVLAGCGEPANSGQQTDPGTEAAESPSSDTEQTDSSAAQSTLPEVSVSAFTTENLNGETVTEAILAEKEYTMINVWGTFCGPCINEMPDLETLSQEMPENMQLIGVICDVDCVTKSPEGIAAAKEIVEATGVTYQNLLLWPNADWFLSTSNVVPTTYFVDSEGNLVSDIIFGADMHAYQAAIEALTK